VVYAKLVESYSMRALSNSEDIVKAFSGILSNVWTPNELGGDLRARIPLLGMDIALLWRSAYSDLFKRRRYSSNTAHVTPT